MPKVEIGNCGWSYFSPGKFIDNWKEKYATRLSAYASLFSVVEVDSIFYKLPSEKLAQKWYSEARDVNKSFEFIPKAPKSITHRNFSTEDLPGFLNVAKALNSSKLLFQTPPSFGYSESNYELVSDFFKRLSKQSNMSIMWEPRGTWLNAIEELKALSQKGIVIVTDPLRKLLDLKQQFYYFRLHGFGSRMMYAYKFTESDLNALRQKLSKKLFNSKKVYVMFNNIYMYEDALRFAKMV
ncbi:MAG: DUF72 domain-containing protein [Candidatus Micrarchaeia archaeon]